MKKLRHKKLYMFFSSLFIFLLHLPFVFAKNRPLLKTIDKPAANYFTVQECSNVVNTTTAAAPSFSLYDSLRLGSLGLARQAFDYAIQGFNLMKEIGKVENYNIISIVDFSKPSSQKRLFVIDLKNYKVLFNTYVAHGINSGKEFANKFSNQPESNKSSLGFYETLGTYVGGHGYSLRLQGIEKGINDNANKRDIVIHAADYVDEKMARSKGYIGRSWGCPAIPARLHRSIIDKIKNGTCLFIYSPDRNYLAHSRMVQQQYPLFEVAKS